MKFTITGSLGNISKPLAGRLVGTGHDVTIVTSSSERSDAIKAIGATPAVGKVEDISFLTSAFRGADAVYAMIPPNFGASDWKKHIEAIGKNYAAAIAASGVRKVVMLSSLGAHMPAGCGPVSGLHFAEKAIDALQGVDVLYLRPGFFYSNFYSNIQMIRGMGIIGSNLGSGTQVVLAHTDDIAAIAARELQQLAFTGKSYKYIVSDERTTDEVAGVLGRAIGKPDLKWVDFTDEQALGGLKQAGLPEEGARNYVEMGTAIRSGEMASDLRKTNKAERGAIRLEDFAHQFAAAYARS